MDYYAILKLIVISQFTLVEGLHHQPECNYTATSINNPEIEPSVSESGYKYYIMLTTFTNSSAVCYMNVDRLRTTLLDQIHPENKNLNISDRFIVHLYCENVLTVTFYSEIERTHKLAIYPNFDPMCRYRTTSLTSLQAAFVITALSDYSSSLAREPLVHCSWADDLEGIYIKLAFEQSLNFLDCITVLDKFRFLRISNLDVWNDNYSTFVENKFPNLRKLDITNSTLTIPPLFPWKQRWNINLTNTDFIKIVELNLNINNITDLNGYQFPSGINVVSLRWNHLCDVSNTTFQLLNTLEELDLSYNDLTSLPQGIFANLTLLKKLDISNNNLATLNENVLLYCSELDDLNLGYNQLSTLPSKLLDKVTKLTHLRLEHNNLTIIPNEFIQLQLTFVSANNNWLDEIPTHIFYPSRLVYVNLQYTGLSQEHLYRLLQTLDKSRIVHDKSEKEYQTTVDMSYCLVQYISREFISSMNIRFALYSLLVNFKVKLDSNPIDCSYPMYTFIIFISVVHRNPDLKRRSLLDYMSEDWKCVFPRQLYGRPVLSIKMDEMYNPINTTDCPNVCHCFKRLNSETVIVDCRDSNITSLSQTLPPSALELWFQNSSVTNITYRRYLENITHLMLNNSKVSYIGPNVFNQMHRLEQLSLRHNLLTHIPENIKLLNISEIMLSENPYTCDCKMKWMKYWLIKSESHVLDVYLIKCSYAEEAKQMIVVRDEDFVCSDPLRLNTVKHVLLPAFASVGGILSIMLLMLCTYAYRHELKVALFVYTGWHPFDKEHVDDNMHVDVTIVHSEIDTDWLMENVVEYLELHNYRVVLGARDFMAGISYQENLRRFMMTSKRLMICVSQTLPINREWFDIAWDFAIHKIKRTKTNFAIVVNRDLPITFLTGKDLKFYLRSKNYIDSRRVLFEPKLLYNMPMPDNQNRQDDMIALNEEIVNIFNSHQPPDQDNDIYKSAFMSYEDEDLGYVVRQLAPLLEDNGFTLCLPDRDFELGVPYADNITDAIDNNGHTILILSEYGLANEWHKYVFIKARDESFSTSAACNHMIVILTGDVDITKLPDDLRLYIESVITLSTEDRWFPQKLFRALKVYGRHNWTDVQDDEEDRPLLQENA